ncbi:haloacid dehalogenase-like hydrolase domain-containing protein 2 isoform X3 [Scylla paramamosain]|uniref:haloacid dehalogenase-like hydrolase domain-containing protein 2 isoform X3 n=1 Tax=Scylla paramamosain TaxID=85552 RepID=UPI0030832FDE
MQCLLCPSEGDFGPPVAKPSARVSSSQLLCSAAASSPISRRTIDCPQPIIVLSASLTSTPNKSAKNCSTSCLLQYPAVSATMAKRIAAVLIDLSGTIHIEDAIIPGAIEALKRLLLDGAPLIAIHKARYYKRGDGLALGPGAFVSGLEYSSGCKAEVVGKPEAAFFHSALQDLGCTPAQAVMIGDDVQDDVCGAMKAGLAGILVKTGKYRPGDESHAELSPSHVAEDFPQAVDFIINNLLQS